MHRHMWLNLTLPITGLAPMDGVTDGAFRQMVALKGKPDVMFTEFTSVEGICAGVVKPLKAFIYSDNEHPIIAQLFGITPDCFYRAFFLMAELGFDGVDINMGCPAGNVSSRGAGAGLIQTPKLAIEIIKATKQAALDWKNGKTINDVNLPNASIEFAKNHQPKQNQQNRLIPISVKTRTGYNTDTAEEWIKNLTEAKPDAITLHGRTFKQLYTGLANYDSIAKAAKIAHKNDITFLGNGDINTIKQGKEICKQHGLDGFLIGRAALGNPWIFSSHTPTIKEKLEAAIEHCKLHEKHLPQVPFVAIRKHLSWYCRGFTNATDIRQQLMHANSTGDVEEILSDLLKVTDTISP